MSLIFPDIPTQVWSQLGFQLSRAEINRLSIIILSEYQRCGAPGTESLYNWRKTEWAERGLGG